MRRNPSSCIISLLAHVIFDAMRRWFIAVKREANPSCVVQLLRLSERRRQTKCEIALRSMSF